MEERIFRETHENIILPYELSDGYDEEIVGEFENKFGEEYFHNFLYFAKPKAQILDLACGDGRHTLKLSDNVEHIIAFDLSSKNLEKARRKCLKKNVSYVKGSHA